MREENLHILKEWLCDLNEPEKKGDTYLDFEDDAIDFLRLKAGAVKGRSDKKVFF